MKAILTFSFLFFYSIICAQIQGVESTWSDSFKEWNVYALDQDGEEIEGHLKMRWQMNEDWSEWDYRIGEVFGAIKVKWKDNPNQWEVRGGGEIINVQTVYRNDMTKWRLSSEGRVLILELNKYDVAFDWRVDNPKYGFYEVYTDWEGDPRSWSVVDELDVEISIHMKMAIIFFSFFSSTPRF
ncbi:MAG: hypothetical protein KJP00_11780 [Bacteroidia bacterium]|nr:hypothetical protein [Bacteroidia bacterium]